jgi:hypothetical protein
VRRTFFVHFLKPVKEITTFWNRVIQVLECACWHNLSFAAISCAVKLNIFLGSSLKFIQRDRPCLEYTNFYIDSQTALLWREINRGAFLARKITEPWDEIMRNAISLNLGLSHFFYYEVYCRPAGTTRRGQDYRLYVEMCDTYSRTYLYRTHDTFRCIFCWSTRWNIKLRTFLKLRHLL